jgi:enoyl-CoA hydratase
VSNLVKYEKRDDHIAIVTLDRPEKRNAVNAEIAQAMDRIVKATEADPDVWVVILTSSNDKVFCAGADLAEVAAGNGKKLYTGDGGFAGFVYNHRTKPWIAAPMGVTVAGGLELCLACDMIVAADNCSFGVPEAKRSLIAGAGGVTRMPRRIPLAIAIELIATGDPISAERALAVGLINRVVPLDKVMDEAIALARAITANAPLAVREGIAVAKQAAMMNDADGQALADEALARLQTTDDYREGPLAFVEKRPPVWKGK